MAVNPISRSLLNKTDNADDSFGVISAVRDFESFMGLSNNEKCRFVHFHVYGNDEAQTPNYYQSLDDLVALEKYIWSHRVAMSRPYVMRLSGNISNRIYRQMSETSDNEEIALNFYFGMMHCPNKDRVNTLAEVICTRLQAEDREND